MNTSQRYLDSNVKIGIRSGITKIGSLLGVNLFNNENCAIQCGIPKIGDNIVVSGSINPTGEFPTSLEFWTAKHGYLYDSNSIIVNSYLYLYLLDSSGSILKEIDLDPVIGSIIQNLLVRTDQYERVPESKTWVNPYYYDRVSRYDPYVTPASPNFEELPRSTAIKTYQFLGGDNNDPSNYIIPASYCGVLGPVYAGFTKISDFDLNLVPKTSPYNKYYSPFDPCDIQVRDIKLDAKQNLWCILQIGWEYCRPTLSQQAGRFYDQELSTWVGYDDSGGYPTTWNLFNTSNWSRQYNPSGDKYRAGPIRPRNLIICFDKKTNYKTWDYVPFRPGTRGFNKLQRESNSRGPAVYGITMPPIKLDVDPYGNIYYAVGTADIWEQQTYNGSLHCNGIVKNEVGYLYVRPQTEFSSTIKEGLDVGRIGPYPQQCTIIAKDFNTVGYYNKVIGDQTKPAFRTPMTWVAGGDRVTITQSTTKHPTTNREYWYANTMGNATAFRGEFIIVTSNPFPHPTVITPKSFGPCEIRAVDYEWGLTNPAIKNRNKDWDLLFASCDFLTRNYIAIASPYNQFGTPWFQPYPYSEWNTHIVPWNKQLNNYVQIHPQNECWFEVGSSATDPFIGFNPASQCGMWYTHFTEIGGIFVEIEAYAHPITDYRYYIYQDFLPMIGNTDPYRDCIARVASIPYALNWATSGTISKSDFFEKNRIVGSLPICKTSKLYEDCLIIPAYDFKHSTFDFTAQTWSSYDNIRTRHTDQLQNAKWPNRFYSHKFYCKNASYDTLDFDNYGIKTEYLDPCSKLDSDFYIPKSKAIVFESDSSITDFENYVDAHLYDPVVVDVSNDIKVRILQSKWHYFETRLPDLNFGVFASALADSNTCGFFVPKYKFHIDFFEDYPNPGDLWANLITETRQYRKLFVVTHDSKPGDLLWTPFEYNNIKCWSKTSTWNPTYEQTKTGIKTVEIYDLSPGQILKSIKKTTRSLETIWGTGAILREYYQQICFSPPFPSGKKVNTKNRRLSPQMIKL